MTRRIVIIIVLLLALSVAVGFGSVAQDDGNLLVNPSFDSEVYTPVSFDATNPAVYYAVPEGWNGGVILSPRSEPWMNIHPTGLPHIGGIKVQGWRSFHVARGGGTFTAFLLQQVNVQPNTPVSGGAWVFIEGTTGIARVGIDPTGGTNPFAPTVVYAETATRGAWSTPSVTVEAGSSGVVTMFLFATQGAPSDPNGVYWDAAYLNGAPAAAPDAPAVEQPGSGANMVTPRVRLYVRSGPGTNFDQIGLVVPGTQWTLLGEEAGWYVIDYRGETGYVSATFVDVVQMESDGGPQAPIPPGSLTFTPYYNLNLRTAPTTGSEAVARIPYNAQVWAIGRSADSNWVQVRYEGRDLWAAAWLGRIDGGSFGSLPVTG